MKRDMDLVRSLLLVAEEIPADSHGLNHVALQKSFPDRSGPELGEHVRLLDEAGLVEAKISTASNRGGVYAFNLERLSWAGHEFLEKIRSETVWRETKQTIGSKGLGIAVDVIASVATAIARQQLGLPPG